MLPVTKSKPKSPAEKSPLELFEASQAQEDRAWMAEHAPALHARLLALIEDTRTNPFAGLGKPEPLKHNWRGWWSRRINAEHRMVYRVSDGVLFVAQYRFHY